MLYYYYYYYLILTWEYFFIAFRERERTIDAREKHWFVGSHTCPSQGLGLNCNLGICPDRELNLPLTGLWHDAPTNWTTPIKAEHVILIINQITGWVSPLIWYLVIKVFRYAGFLMQWQFHKVLRWQFQILCRN